MTSERPNDSLDAPRLLAELRVHQAELEEQNVALREARDVAEAVLSDYTELYDFAPVGYATVGADGRIETANLALSMLLGVERSRLVGQPITRWVAPTEREALVQCLAHARISDGSATIDLTLHRESNAPCYVTVSASHTPGRNDCRVAITDQTRRHEAERLVQQSQKMEAIGRLAGGVAHDINNLLTVIGVHTDLILAAIPKHEPASEDALAVQAAVTRATALTAKLMAFARPQILDRRRFAVDDAVEAFHALFRRILPARIAFQVATGAPGAAIVGDPVQLEQVLMNLALNSADAMPNGGQLRIETFCGTLEAEDLVGQPSVRPGPFVCMRVVDTGSGMDAATQAHVFEPFFTTKPIGKGTGLGLATVYAIVHQAGGIVRLTSAPGAGTTFDVWWPQSQSHIPRPEPAWPDASVGGAETVLVVDDEPLIRRLATRLLAQVGYHTLSAANGIEALAIVARQGEQLSLILSDVVMPEMSGPEFVRLLHGTHPGLPVIFMTGYASGLELAGRDVPPHAAVLHKPFDAATLARTVRNVLDAQ